MSEIRKKTDALIGLAPGAGDILLSMNLSTTSDIMCSSVSWCRIISSEEENLATGQHKHIMHELQYVYEGELRIVTDHSIACHPDEYIFIPSGVEHRIADRASSTRKLVIGFEVSSPNEAIGSLFNKAQRPIVSKASPAFHALAEALLFKTSSINLTASVSVAYIIHTLLLEMVDSLAASSGAGSDRLRESMDSQYTDRILSFINENALGSIACGDVAKATGLSERQTSRVCRRLFGCSLNHLIVRVRMKQICALLIDSKYSIAEIAEIAGFSSPYSFSRHFSHYTGVTPSSYRRNFEIHN